VAFRPAGKVGEGQSAEGGCREPSGTGMTAWDAERLAIRGMMKLNRYRVRLWRFPHFWRSLELKEGMDGRWLLRSRRLRSLQQIVNKDR
jgi:hypothetical protein